MVLLVTILSLVPSAEHLPLVQSVSDVSSALCLSVHSGTSSHKPSLSCLLRRTYFWLKQFPLVLFRVFRDALILLVTSPFLVPFVAYLLLLEPFSAASSPRVSRYALILLVTSPPLVPSVAHLLLVEQVSAVSSPCLSGRNGTRSH